MAEISTPVWIIMGIIVSGASFALNMFTNSYKFAIFLAIGIGMVLIGIIKALAEKGFEREKKLLDAKIKADDEVSRQRTAAMERQHKAKMQALMQQQQQRQLAGQNPQIQGVKYCNGCGHLLNSSDRFCFNCGARQG